MNGKHIKDWIGDRRTVLVPGGTVITMGIVRPMAGVTTVSIHDVDVSHRFDAVERSHLGSSTNAAEAAEWEQCRRSSRTAENTSGRADERSRHDMPWCADPCPSQSLGLWALWATSLRGDGGFEAAEGDVVQATVGAVDGPSARPPRLNRVGRP